MGYPLSFIELSHYPVFLSTVDSRGSEKLIFFLAFSLLCAIKTLTDRILTDASLSALNIRLRHCVTDDDD